MEQGLIGLYIIFSGKIAKWSEYMNTMPLPSMVSYKSGENKLSLAEGPRKS